MLCRLDRPGPRRHPARSPAIARSSAAHWHAQRTSQPRRTFEAASGRPRGSGPRGTSRRLGLARQSPPDALGFATSTCIRERCAPLPMLRIHIAAHRRNRRSDRGAEDPRMPRTAGSRASARTRDSRTRGAQAHRGRLGLRSVSGVRRALAARFRLLVARKAPQLHR